MTPIAKADSFTVPANTEPEQLRLQDLVKAMKANERNGVVAGKIGRHGFGTARLSCKIETRSFASLGRTMTQRDP